MIAPNSAPSIMNVRPTFSLSYRAVARWSRFIEPVWAGGSDNLTQVVPTEHDKLKCVGHHRVFEKVLAYRREDVEQHDLFVHHSRAVPAVGWKVKHVTR